MPFQSTLSQSVGKLLKTFRSRDATGAGRVTSTVRTDRRPVNLLTVPVGVYPSGKWDLLRQGDLTLQVGGTYDVGVSLENGAGATMPITIHMWGAGGGAGRGPGNPGGQAESAGGGGGYTTASMTVTHGDAYKYVVGNAKGANGAATPWGDPGGAGNPNSPTYSPTGKYHSGGYSGIFVTSVSAPNARIMAGGGGAGGSNDSGTQGLGGGGGGASGTNAGSPGGIPQANPFNGEGGTSGAGGAGGTSPHTNGTAGGPLAGGTGGQRGGSGAAGGGGGAGWYGGGGGAGQTSINTNGGAGGGGSGYLHPSISGGTTTAATTRAAANNSSPYYVTDRAKGGIYTPGSPETDWGSPGIITIVLN